MEIEMVDCGQRGVAEELKALTLKEIEMVDCGQRGVAEELKVL
jgi:hypothetical protein